MDKNLFEKMMDDHNLKPLDDFCGFSPKEMSSIIYTPFEEPKHNRAPQNWMLA